MRFVLAVPTLAVLLAACGRSEAPAPGTAPPASSPYALGADPALDGALAVVDARKSDPRAEVVVVGRVRDVVAGFAAFTLVDASLAYCGAGSKEEGCATPWDYCCHADEEIASHSLPVAVKKQGDVVALARIPELRRLDLVAVRGSLVKDAHGQVSLEATGWYRRERPTLPQGIVFPE